MSKSVIVLIFTFSSFCINSLHADEALDETLVLMTDSKKIDELAQKDSAVKSAIGFVEQTVGTGKEKEDLLKISSQIMEVLVKKHKGDLPALQADLMNALKDPAKFLENLPESEKKQIRNLATQVESKNTPDKKLKP